MSEKAGLAKRQARGFDRLAPIYDVLARVGSFGRIHRSQVALLPLIPQAQEVLIVGGGTGRFLVDMLKGGTASRVVSIDLSPEMTRQTADRLAKHRLSDRADLRVGDLDSLRPNEQFDVVVTHCFLDLFNDEELASVAAALKRALRPGGLWLFSDFSTSGRGLPKSLRKAIVASLYASFRFAGALETRSLPDFAAAFARIGLAEVASMRFAGGLLEARLMRKNRP